MKSTFRQLSFFFCVLLAATIASCGKKEETSNEQGAHSIHAHSAEADRQLYQCSMHPNIISDKPGNCPICGMTLQPIRKVSAAGIPGRGAVDLTEQQRQLINIRTMQVKMSEAHQTVRAVGVVTYDQSKVADLTSRVMGWVEELFVDKPGEHVEAGQPLMELYSPDLYSAKQDYLLAWNSVRKAKLTRGEYGAARASGADSILESARKRLELFGITDEQINALQTSGTAKPTMEIVAPFAGTVLQKEVVVGKMIQPSAILYRIADLSRVWVEAEIYEYELPLVKVGQAAQVSLDRVSGPNVSRVRSILFILICRGKPEQQRFAWSWTIPTAYSNQRCTRMSNSRPILDASS